MFLFCVDLHGIPKLLLRLRLMVPNVFSYFSIPLIRSFSALRSRLILIRESRQLHKSPPWNLQYIREMLIHPSMASRVSQNSNQIATEAANEEREAEAVWRTVRKKYCTTSYTVIMLIKILVFNLIINIKCQLRHS